MLTTPIPSAKRRAYKGLRRFVRPILRPGVPLPPVSRFPGHFAVVRSVVEGLEQIGADFNHDPRSFRKLARIVYAPANEALRQAARLKREKKIDYLVAGPSNAFFPEEADNIFWLPEIDTIIEPSDWVKELFRSIAPPLVSKIRICTAGVDTAYWKPRGERSSTRAIVYWKSGDESFSSEVEDILRARGLDPVRFQYGHYARDDYRYSLDGAALAVFLSSFETQGIALAEAWAMDVPTLVWDPRAETQWRGRPFISGSSAPYLSVDTGMRWVTLADLTNVIGEALSRRESYRPREWVLANMTDAICSSALLEIISSECRTQRRNQPR